MLSSSPSPASALLAQPGDGIGPGRRAMLPCRLYVFLCGGGGKEEKTGQGIQLMLTVQQPSRDARPSE